MSQEAQEPRLDNKQAPKEEPESEAPVNYPALQWQKVESSIPVHTFTNYKLKLNGWVRKDKLRVEETEEESISSASNVDGHDMEHTSEHESETEAKNDDVRDHDGEEHEGKAGAGHETKTEEGQKESA
ncbi:LAQU0S02e09538g1_1 [Lachancea quebecensis]|uniref:LAQU0S02e09538g1_1 n=1 Tax=Lachancea quebecensis TaxID=1654605 RepID=A0A0P1KR08_9SACH|nr:LAQU0S02e09538g1_1 [Lachancea quebecensis]